MEGLGDVAFAIAPLNNLDIEFLFSQTWAGQRLKGFREQVPGDSGAVRMAILRLAQLMINHPEVEEIEVNPLTVMPEGQGCWVVDARMVLESGNLDLVR